MEQQFNAEKSPISKQEVLYRLKEYGREDPATMELLGAWIDENKKRVRMISDMREQVHADVTFELEKITLYIEAGFLEEAEEELSGSQGVEGMIDVVSTDEQVMQVKELLHSIALKK